MRQVRLLNRWLWVVLALVILGGAGWLGAELARVHAPAEPLAVPRLVLAPLPAETALAEAPQRNPFDPSGAPWFPTTAPLRISGGGELQGIVILPGKRGVMTSKGFVAAGEDFAGGRIEKVERHRVVIRSGAGERVIPIGAERAQLLQKLMRGSDAPGAEGRPAR